MDEKERESGENAFAGGENRGYEQNEGDCLC